MFLRICNSRLTRCFIRVCFYCAWRVQKRIDSSAIAAAPWVRSIPSVARITNLLKRLCRLTLNKVFFFGDWFPVIFKWMQKKKKKKIADECNDWPCVVHIMFVVPSKIYPNDSELLWSSSFFAKWQCSDSIPVHRIVIKRKKKKRFEWRLRNCNDLSLLGCFRGFPKKNRWSRFVRSSRAMCPTACRRLLLCTACWRSTFTTWNKWWHNIHLAFNAAAPRFVFVRRNDE